MRVLVISDIHSNLSALQAVLADSGAVDETWCLGDLIGYGPDPNEVVTLLRKQPNMTAMLGNHDVAALGQMDYAIFNADARKSLLWQKDNLTAENIEYLESLPQGKCERENVTMAHGSPRDPVWEYILNTLAARMNYDAFSTPFCLVGHTHLQTTFYLNTETDRISQVTPRAGSPYQLTPRTILNPGSVGQPRDRDPRSAYAIFDTQTCIWEPRRVAYDIAAVQNRIRAAGLPEKHAARLADGW